MTPLLREFKVYPYDRFHEEGVVQESQINYDTCCSDYPHGAPSFWKQPSTQIYSIVF